MTTLTKKQVAEQQDAIDTLRELLSPGDEVLTILRHVSSSGMMRHISTVIVRDEHTRDISYLVARATRSNVENARGAIKVGGCGMDMGFHLVYNLSYYLFPSGFDCIGDKCPSNDHSNGDRDYTPGHAHHADGGYALRQRWM